MAGKSPQSASTAAADPLTAAPTLSLKALKLKTKQQELLLRAAILALVYILAFATRLFSVLRYESMIHEFDPYFNYRTTLYLTQKGFYEFWNWFDFESWYPLGRVVGGTLYPGLMVTAAIIYWGMRFLRFAVHIREVCVLTAPFFASNTTIVAYFFGKEVWDSGAGLVAAALIAICPGYISRSVAGSYDNEGVAIFALLLTFYLFVKAVNTGSLAWALGSAFGYFYMVSAWGGYVFIINLIPLYVMVLLITGRYSMRLYVAYNCMYILGMLLAMQIRFVGFQHVQSGEHMAAMGVFFLMQVFYFLDWVKYMLNDTKLFQAFLRITVTCAIGVGGVALGVGTASGYISPWTGRFYSLLDPTYAKDHIPIIASVSEHQPTAWSSFMFDFHILLILFPAGLYFCFKRLSDATIFIVMYGLTSMYFAGVMVRLILVATPAVCLISAIAVSATIKNLTQLVRSKSKAVHSSTGKGASGTKASSKASLDQSMPFQKNGAMALLLGAFFLLSRYVIHCTWVTSEAYSSPSIVLAARGAYGNRVIFDDYREAYFWLRQNTPQDAKIMSWWLKTHPLIFTIPTKPPKLSKAQYPYQKMAADSLDMSPFDRKILMEKLTEGRELAKELKIILDKPFEKDGHLLANDLVVKILSSFTGSISMTNRSLTEFFLENFPDIYVRKEDSGDNSNSSVSKNRRGCYKRRKRSHTATKIVPHLIDDGHAWRKYGQKVILNAKHPRNYFRCTHKFDQSCQATKQVQQTDDEQPMYQVTYHGIHTCQKPRLNTGQIIFETAHFNESQYLLSFNSGNKSHDDPRFPNFPSVKQDYSPAMDQNKSPPHGCHMSSDMTGIGSSAPMSVFSPGSDQGDVLSYFSATSAPNDGFDNMDMLGFNGFCENLELDFEHCYT